MTPADHEIAFESVLFDVRQEVARQALRWGYQERSFQEWEIILAEELAEAKTQAIIARETAYEELVQAAAVILSWLRNIEALDNKKEK